MTCPQCQGERELFAGWRSASEYDAPDEIWEPCDACNGTGKIDQTE